MQLMVFTDLDGTLLDHDTYSHTAAHPALNALSRIGAPVILASSKTGAEIAQLRAELGLKDLPAIVENGAALDDGGTQNHIWQSLRAALDELPKDLRANFKGFGDMGPGGVAQATGLPPQDAARAAQRRFSEPGLWTGSDEDLSRFQAALAAKGISARRGGRFLTLSHGATKADRMRDLIDQFQPERTVALGDAPNDKEMLETADIGIIIRNDHGPGLPPLQGETEGRIRRTTLPGPAGWNDAMLNLLNELGLTETAPHG